MRDLPDHIWSIVVDDLQFSIDKCICGHGVHLGKAQLDGIMALSRLSRTSSRFYRLTQRPLYRSLPAGHSQFKPRVFSTLKEHPHLAAHVEYVDLSESVLSSDEIASFVLDTEMQPSPASESVSIQLRQLLALEGPNSFDKLADAWFCYCISLLPSLRALEMTLGNRYTMLPSLFRDSAKVCLEVESHNHGTATLGSIGGGGGRQDEQASAPAKSIPPSSRSNIEELRLNYWDNLYALDLAPLWDLLALPSLRTFYGTSVDLGPCSAAPHVPMRELQLRHVYLVHSLAEADGIQNLLSLCPSINTLRIHWGSATVGNCDLDFSRIGEVLRQYGTGLEVLELDCRECFSYTEEEWVGKIGDLRALQRLEKLALPQDILLGIENELDEFVLEREDIDDKDDSEEAIRNLIRLEPRLPDSLEDLRFYDCYDEGEWVQSSVATLFQSTRLARLRRIQLDNAALFSFEIDGTKWQSQVHNRHYRFYRDL